MADSVGIVRRLIGGVWTTLAAGDSDATPVSVLQRSTTLDNDQIKALPTTPVELVPAPETGILLLVRGYMRLSLTQIYTNVHAQAVLIVRNGPIQSALVPAGDNNWLDVDIGDFWGTLSLKQQIDYPIEGQAGETVGHDTDVQPLPLSLEGRNPWPATDQGDFTGGHEDNFMTVTVWYGIADITTS